MEKFTKTVDTKTRSAKEVTQKEPASAPEKKSPEVVKTNPFRGAYDDGYRPIEDHGMIGNMNTVALIGADACIDWYCYPTFQSPSLFGGLLDCKKGGHWSIRAASTVRSRVRHRQAYHSETNVLITRFLSTTGVAVVQDFMPIKKSGEIGYRWLMRELEVVRGRMDFEVECVPAFNYGRDKHELQIVSHGARFVTEKLKMVLTCTQASKWEPSGQGGAKLLLSLEEGQKVVFLLRESLADAINKGEVSNPYEGHQHPDPTGHPASVDTTEALRAETMEYWRTWLSKCTYVGRWREQVHRSALALKLLTYEPTGAIVAAPTTSLPEWIGGSRNWDYRFTWIRDSSMVLYAFLRLGFKEEAKAFTRWIEARCEEIKEDGSLQIMYGIDGDAKLDEFELSHLEGYMKSKPVRVGNGAFGQRQLDIYGELMDTIYMSNKYAEPISFNLWRHLRKMVEWVIKHWQEKDEGIWEVRSQQEHFTYSKIMCWVCLDRAIRLAERRSFPCELERWRAERDKIYMEIQEKGWNEKQQAFTQHYGSDTLDASCLVMPWVHFMAPSDPRFIKTMDAILKSVPEGGLVSNNLVFRYNLQKSIDGLDGEEGTFSICTFWAVEALARVGMYQRKYLDRARLMFEQTLGYANHLGLYSEEIGMSGEALGNFPQAFTHLAFISAAFNLDKALNEASGKSGSGKLPHLEAVKCGAT